MSEVFFFIKKMKPLIFIFILLETFVSEISTEAIWSDRSYLRVEAGIYSRLTVAIDEEVAQPKNCQTYLDNLEVRLGCSQSLIDVVLGSMFK